LSGRGLCDELITRPEESYRLWCVVCDLETSWMRRPWPTGGLLRQNKQTNRQTDRQTDKQTNVFPYIIHRNLLVTFALYWSTLWRFPNNAFRVVCDLKMRLSFFRWDV
jgi:hypothetical protein